MSTNIYERITACARHRLSYNAESGPCPLCDEERETHRLSSVQVASSGTQRFACPFCGARSIYEGSCSRYVCRKKAGLLRPHSLVNICAHCGSRTKYARSCTRYPCRQKAGTMSMYYRQR
jgi:hypothetical protein